MPNQDFMVNFRKSVRKSGKRTSYFHDNCFQELSWGGGGGGGGGSESRNQGVGQNTLAKVKLSWNEVQGAVELIISCTEVLTLLSDEHFGNVEIKWTKKF